MRERTEAGSVIETKCRANRKSNIKGIKLEKENTGTSAGEIVKDIFKTKVGK